MCALGTIVLIGYSFMLMYVHTAMYMNIMLIIMFNIDLDLEQQSSTRRKRGRVKDSTDDGKASTCVIRLTLLPLIDLNSQYGIYIFKH